MKEKETKYFYNLCKTLLQRGRERQTNNVVIKLAGETEGLEEAVETRAIIEDYLADSGKDIVRMMTGFDYNAGLFILRRQHVHKAVVLMKALDDEDKPCHLYYDKNLSIFHFHELWEYWNGASMNIEHNGLSEPSVVCMTYYIMNTCEGDATKKKIKYEGPYLDE